MLGEFLPVVNHVAACDEARPCVLHLLGRPPCELERQPLCRFYDDIAEPGGALEVRHEADALPGVAYARVQKLEKERAHCSLASSGEQHSSGGQRGSVASAPTFRGRHRQRKLRTAER